MTEVSERTIYNWVKEGSWEQLRTDALLAPSQMMHHFINQLLDLQNSIAAREPGKRNPDPKEIETQRKLLKAILDLKKYPTELISSYQITTVSDINEQPQQDNPALENRNFLMNTNEIINSVNKFEISAKPEIQMLKPSQGNDNKQLIESCVHPATGNPSAKTGNLNSNTNKKIFGKLMHSHKPVPRSKDTSKTNQRVIEKHEATFLMK